MQSPLLTLGVNSVYVLFIPKEKHTDIHTIVFWVAWQQIELYTLHQFLSVYRAKWVMDPFAPKIGALKYNILISVGGNILQRAKFCYVRTKPNFPVIVRAQVMMATTSITGSHLEFFWSSSSRKRDWLLPYLMFLYLHPAKPKLFSPNHHDRLVPLAPLALKPAFLGVVSSVQLIIVELQPRWKMDI